MFYFRIIKRHYLWRAHFFLRFLSLMWLLASSSSSKLLWMTISLKINTGSGRYVVKSAQFVRAGQGRVAKYRFQKRADWLHFSFRSIFLVWKHLNKLFLFIFDQTNPFCVITKQLKNIFKMLRTKHADFIP